MVEAVSAQAIARILSITDAAGIHREAVRIPLTPSAQGSARVTASGHVEITAPSAALLESFLAELGSRLRAMDLSGVRRAN